MVAVETGALPIRVVWRYIPSRNELFHENVRTFWGEGGGAVLAERIFSGTQYFEIVTFPSCDCSDLTINT